MAKSPEELAHLEWLGYVQPLGLVVSIPAMLEAQCYVNKNIMGEHTRFLSCLPRDKSDEVIPEIRDLPELTRKVLGWEAKDLKEVPQRVELTDDMAPLEVVLPQYHETLRPTHAVPAFHPKHDENPWIMLIQELGTGTNLDEPAEADSAKHWNAAPQAKFERLLRETEVPIGLLSNGRQLRLVYSPRGETSGHATFNVDEMIQVAGRPMFAALQMLLCGERMFSLGDNQRLPAILENSRKYQNTVSTKLAEQVLEALYELMRGFQAASDVRKGELLRDVLASDPNHVYSGLLTVLMRLVFVMYAEDRDLVSTDPVYSNHYSVTGLFARLRSDAGRFPDTMNQRFGAWSQLITLFRLVYEGGQHKTFKLPPRKGYLFDPGRYPFLEGRQRDSADSEVTAVPRIPDGVVFRVLQNLLILDGERLSYRTLDVEQIGSVYETVMGFNLEVAEGKSIAIKPVKSHGAPTTINLEALLETAGKDRAKWLKEQSDQKLGVNDAKQLRKAESVDDLLASLEKKIAKKVTPRVVHAGAIVLQPSDERRRSGSHYTPRSLTEPIVRTTLEPVLKQLADPEADLPAPYKPSREDKQRYTKSQLDARVRHSEKAVEAAKRARKLGTSHPSQILDLKICDPAMGSGAFLVETCRQLGAELVNAWHTHNLVPSDIPPDEDEELYARRLIAQRCLYGVDKNDMAVDLAKLSLWLATLAKDHPFTFLDHSLRHGDSLVGLTRRQIIGFHWEPKKQKSIGEDLIQKRLDRATEARAEIMNAREDVLYHNQERRLAVADDALNVIRMTGDACVSAFFAGSKQRERQKRCEESFSHVSDWYASGHDISKQVPIETAAAKLRSGEHSIPAFHWEIEFPEVFSHETRGFDGFVGNPPFLGGKRISTCYGDAYRDWLAATYSGTNSNADLVAFFFRRTFDLLRSNRTLGLIATNSIAQGDTRSAALRWIVCEGSGYIYNATKRKVWPGEVSVVVSIVHIAKLFCPAPRLLNGEERVQITAFLFHSGSSSDPARLAANDAKSFIGCFLRGKGFIFSSDSDGTETSSLLEKERILRDNPRCGDCVFPFLSGAEINDSPTHEASRYVINFGGRSIAEAEAYPELLAILRAKVKPVRDKLGSSSVDRAHKKFWWRFANDRPEMNAAIADFRRVLVVSRVRATGFTFVPPDVVPSEQVVVFAFEDIEHFAVLQSRIHEMWAHFFSGTALDLIRYSPSDCFETFPFPEGLREIAKIRECGENCFSYRSELMIKKNQGLTDTYNRFHDPHEKSGEIQKLRELHDAMDRAVLEAYGWDDLAQSARCEFLLDYEEEGDVDESGRKSKKNKPWRLRWPDVFRDEVLARILELNEQRANEEEALMAKSDSTVTKKNKKTKARSRSKSAEATEQMKLFESEK